jgi:hypothetical protein
VFAKMGCGSRGVLLARALGTGAGPRKPAWANGARH